MYNETSSGSPEKLTAPCEDMRSLLDELLAVIGYSGLLAIIPISLNTCYSC